MYSCLKATEFYIFGCIIIGRSTLDLITLFCKNSSSSFIYFVYVNISDNIRRDGEFKIIKGTNYLCMKAGRLIVQISSRLQYLRFLNQSCLVAICDESNWLEVQLQEHRFPAWILECYEIINCSVAFVLFLFIMLKYSQLLWPSEHYDCFSHPLLCLRLGYFM